MNINIKQAKVDHSHANIELLNTWFNDSSHYLTGAYSLSFDVDTTKDEPSARSLLYTRDNTYSISVLRDYLGCTCNSRRPDVGQSWTRGRDLPDGCFNKETWNKIMAAIAFHELKGIAGVIK